MDRTGVLAIVSCAVASVATWDAATARADEFFESSIRPLLERRCYECHSHSSGRMQGGLTLDSRSGWERGGDSGPAVVPGETETSLLIRKVRWADAKHSMPPTGKLSDDEIGLLERWVELGAPDPRTVETKAGADWWSLQPLRKPEIPETPAVPATPVMPVRSDTPPLVAHPIDAFVRAKLAEAGLSPAPPADRRTLIRRLHVDLHGLPPSPEEVEAFVSDPDPLACEKLVDRLLESPRYGERWARHWLDTIHFADTHGFEHDDFRPNAWRYRDYVIASLNRDTPWDRFVREQLAADVFFPGEPALTAALGFLGAGNYDSSAAGTAPASFAYFDRDDLVTQTMAAFASTTANCARCHAHKFDPITQQDYFALQAVFAGIGKGDVAYDEDPLVAARRRAAIALEAAIASQDASVLLSEENTALADAWDRARASDAALQTLKPEVFVSTEGCKLERLPDDSILAGGATPDKDTVTITGTTTSERVTALRLDLLTDDSLPARGPGRASNGNLHVSEVEVRVFRPGASQPDAAPIRRATSDFDQTGYDVAKAIDGNPATSWAVHPAVGTAHHAVFEFAAPIALEPGARLAITLRQLQGGSHLLGRFRLSIASATASTLTAVSEAVETALRVAQSERTPEQRLARATAALRERARDELASLPPQVKVWAAARTAENERGVVTIAEPVAIHLLRRGELDKPAEEVGPGALSAISAITGLPARFELADPKNESARRAALADWLADARHPLTWRSVVNRVWHYHFGRGLCDTPSDFGRMGGAPSHPELIDWLAAWFRDEAHGSLKALHRLIVTSETYRQASTADERALAVDPDDRLLWRWSRQRLDADTVRDSILAISGRLDLTMGGPGVELFTTSPGPQSTPVLNYASFDRASPAGRRRSIYRVVWRSIGDPFLDALDFPDMGLLSPVRGFSASALQSLALFNDEFVLRHCEFLAERVESMATTPESSGQRVRSAFRLALQRDPTADETDAFTVLATEHGLPAACRVLFNTNEFLFLD